MPRRRRTTDEGAGYGTAPAPAHPESNGKADTPADPSSPVQPGGPPLGYISAQRVALEERDKGRNDLLNNLESLRFHTSETDPSIPSAYEKTTVKVRGGASLLGNQIDQVTAALTMNPWRTRLDNSSEDDDGARTDGELERATNRLFDTLDRCAGRDVRHLMTDQVVATGRTVVKVAHKADWFRRYPTAERVHKKPPEDLDDTEHADLKRTQTRFKKQNPMPFYWEDLDARSYHGVGGGNGQGAESLVVAQVAKLPLMQRYDLLMMRDGTLKRRDKALADAADIVWDARRPYGAAYLPERVPIGVSTTSEWVEHWTIDEPNEETGEIDGGWYTYVVDGDVVRQRRHAYSRLPFFEIFGLRTSSRDPKHEALSTIFHLAGLALLLDSYLTIGSNVAYWEGFPTYQEVPNPQLVQLLGGQSNFNPLQNRKTTFDPGTLLHPTLGEIKAVANAGFSQALDRMVGQVEGLIGQIGISSVLKGNLGGDPSGWLANQLMTAALIGFYPITSGLSAGASSIIDHVYRMTERIVGEEIHLGDARIKPEDVGKYGPYNIAVDIKPKLPQNEIARGTFGDQGVRNGTISQKRNREEFWGIEDPVAEQDQIDREAALQDPMVLEAKKKIALYDPEFGIVQMLEHAAQVEAAFLAQVQTIQQQAQPPPAPAPVGETGVFEPGLNGAPLLPPEPVPGAGAGPAPSTATGLAAQGGGQPQAQPFRGVEVGAGP